LHSQWHQLKILHLEQNDLSGFSIPDSLAGLAELYLTENNLTDTLFLGSRTNLEVLYLDSNFVGQVVIPNSWSGLKALNLRGNVPTLLCQPGCTPSSFWILAKIS
jgi:hypothetical protein